MSKRLQGSSAIKDRDGKPISKKMKQTVLKMFLDEKYDFSEEFIANICDIPLNAVRQILVKANAYAKKKESSMT